MILTYNWENLNGVSDMSHFSIINQNGVSEGELKDMNKQIPNNIALTLSWENLNGVSDMSHYSIISQNGLS